MDPFFSTWKGSSLSKQHHFTSPASIDFSAWGLGSTARLNIYGVAIFLAVSFLLLQRFLSGDPFFLPADYRSYNVVNRRLFLELYDADELPKAPIEELRGTRLRLAWIQALCFSGLVSINAALLILRRLRGELIIDEVAELAYWTFLSTLFLYRFYPNPYRPTLQTLTSVGSLVPLLLIMERDILPKLLLHPSRERLLDVRTGWVVYTRLGLTLAIGILALATPRVWYPVDPSAGGEPTPEQVASPFSYAISYYWIESIIRIAYRRDVEVEDLLPIPDYDRGKLWSRMIANHRRSTTFWTLLSLMKYELFLMTLFSFLIGATQFIWPLSMKHLLAYIEGSSQPIITPWAFVLGMFFGPLLGGVAWEAYVFQSNRVGIRVKAALTQSLLEKTLKIRFTADSVSKEEKQGTAEIDKGKKDKAKPEEDHQKSRVGRINNLMSSDLSQLSSARSVIACSNLGEAILFSMIFLYGLLGWSSIVGVAMMIVTMIIPGILAKLLSKVQRRTRLASDVRIEAMTETLNSVRIIKFFGMEKVFLSRIREKRENELWLSFLSMVYTLGFYTISHLLPIINMIVTFGIYTEVMKLPLTPTWVSHVTRSLISAFIAFDRVDKFLIEEEELETAEQIEGAAKREIGPYFRNATLSWSMPGSGTDDGFRLANIDVECVYGGLTVIAGPVGSGKSSFLLGLLEEMRLLSGERFLPRGGGVAYVAQTAWLQSLTIKDNILFGSPYEEKRYNAVLEACGLSEDMEKFDAGDLTEVRVRIALISLVTLSGGQKARLALARAVYSPAQTVLLDDVLSALDAGTSKLVFERCIKGEVLAGRTVVLVTHHVSLVSSAAKKIIVLDNGRMVSDSSPEALSDDAIELLRENEEADIVAGDVALGEPVEQPIEAMVPEAKLKNSRKLVAEEARNKGRVPKKLVFEYLGYFGPLIITFFLVLISMLDKVVDLVDTFYIGLWSNEYSKPGPVDVKWWLVRAQAVSKSLLIGASIFNTLVYCTWYFFAWVGARRIHEKLVSAVLYSPIRFFDTTPVGRIINRLSNDIAALDNNLGPYVNIVFDQLLDIVFRAAVMTGLLPAFLLPTILVSFIGITCGELYVRAQIGVKRIISVKESPLISHFGDTISGIVTIRAFSCQERFREENIKKIDDFTQPNEVNYNLNRWIGIRTSVCTSVIGAAAGIIALTTKDSSPGMIGFSMSNALAFSSSILLAVRYFNLLEVELNSFERVKEYIEMKQEPSSRPEAEPPAAWPTQGDLKVTELSVKYSEDGPEVLNRISFEIKPSERVGIVGRTGAGKSSLALSLLRFTEISNGSIVINGLDVQKINLEALRQRVTIIPQDPVLFSGTVRTNLDPFGSLDDTELQAALGGSGLAEAESSTAPNSKQIGLDTQITSGGGNLSQGQRQLLAFARALIRRSKLVIFDEATSSTDLKTDERIQETIRTSFPDSTLITIAHRLRTVMSFDRIIVLDNLGNGGEIVEFDTPFNLLQNPEGMLYNLARKSGEFEELLKLAKGRD
ncbi:P-loop containing nucleoside triphosphate hydrolase protein [Tuber magnatum]|uniref:P-loop containing nucleoside triphosphate hydrolase protein n=1 Tax=Tuber magnatum TaxID=42249 RepID=A0A317SYK7_9PEZI|nr:P-loop containing nucleoside triphosphate hydrolase protein [Tuber magnatum]